jgi:hypothetical protein
MDPLETSRTPTVVRALDKPRGIVPDLAERVDVSGASVLTLDG